MSDRKVILYVHHGKGLGGAPISLLTLIKGLDLEKFKPLVVFLYNSEALDLFKQEGVRTIGPLNSSDFSHTNVYWFRWYHFHRIIKSIIGSIFCYFQAVRIIKKIHPDIVHLNTSSLLSWGIAAKKLSFPVVWHIRETLATGHFGIRQAFIKKIIEDCATKIIPICKADGKFWNNGKKIVLYNPVDNNIFQEKPLQMIQDHQYKYLLFVGGLSLQKGTDFMLQIFESVLQSLPKTRLIIAGNFIAPQKTWKSFLSSEQQHNQAAYTHYKKLKANIIVTGPTKNVPALMQQASIIFFPAQVDHFARPIIEAGFMKKTVMASDFPQLQEIIINEKTGFLLPHDNPNPWVEKTIEILQNETLEKELGENNFTYCTQRFNLPLYSKAINQIYVDITAKSARKSFSN